MLTADTGEPESVATQHDPRVDQATFSDLRVLVEHDVRPQLRAFADAGPAGDDAARTDDCTGSDRRAGLDDRVRPDGDVARELRPGRDAGAGIDSGGTLHGGMVQLQQLGEREIRLAVNEQRPSGRLDAPRDQKRCGLTFRRLRAVLRVGQEAELSRPGAVERGDAVDFGIAATPDLPGNALGQF